MSGRFDADPPDDDIEMLAAEYVLGLLSAEQLPNLVAARDRAQFDRAVNQWELRFLPFTEDVQPVQPPARLWPAIAGAISPAAAPGSIWDNVRFWRNFGFGTGILGAGLAAALVAVLVNRAAPIQPAMPVATATLASSHAGIFVATAQQIKGGFQLVVSPSQAIVPVGKSAELWLITPGNKPAPLGLLASSHPVTVTVPASELAGNIGLAELAVSIEPPGGSPTGQATGPIISVAKFLPL
jgi:anti-sigma-K factor RskA